MTVPCTSFLPYSVTAVVLCIGGPKAPPVALLVPVVLSGPALPVLTVTSLLLCRSAPRASPGSLPSLVLGGLPAVPLPTLPSLFLGSGQPATPLPSLFLYRGVPAAAAALRAGCALLRPARLATLLHLLRAPGGSGLWPAPHW